MENYTSEDIRNIALVGHAGCGKTELAEALLLQSGAINSRGSLERGTMVCDFDPQEKILGHSLDFMPFSHVYVTLLVSVTNSSWI